MLDAEALAGSEHGGRVVGVCDVLEDEVDPAPPPFQHLAQLGHPVLLHERSERFADALPVGGRHAVEPELGDLRKEREERRALALAMGAVYVKRGNCARKTRVRMACAAVTADDVAKFSR